LPLTKKKLPERGLEGGGKSCTRGSTFPDRGENDTSGGYSEFPKNGEKRQDSYLQGGREGVPSSYSAEGGRNRQHTGGKEEEPNRLKEYAFIKKGRICAEGGGNVPTTGL